MQEKECEAAGKIAPITAVVLAGGQGSRLGGQDKGLVLIKGKHLAQYVLEKLRQQGVERIIVSANRNGQEYQTLFAEVVTDRTRNFSGPLAGIAAAMERVGRGYLIAVPCDSPFFPDDYVERLVQAFERQPQLSCVAARAQGKCQPVFCMVRCDLAASLESFLKRGESKVRLWLEENKVQWIDFPSIDDFMNINTPRDLEMATKILSE